jgi:hypothetical protein
MNYTKAEQAEGMGALREYVTEGVTIYTIIRSISRSGMSRRLSVIVFRDNEPFSLDWAVSRALDYPLRRVVEGIRVDGCGMDMGYHVASSIASAVGVKDWKHRWI